MKRIILSTAVVAILGVLPVALWGQSATSTSEPASAPIPHKIGLIDLARVFQDYEKFKGLREDLRSEIEQSDQQAKAMAQQIQTTRAKLSSGTLKEGSEVYIKLEGELAKQASEFEAYRKVEQQKFLRKEAQVYRTVYEEVLEVVQLYAEHFKYTLVMRFSAEKLDSGNPQKLIQGLNRPVVYHRTEDDITDSVLEFLNRKYTEAKKPTTNRTSQKSSAGNSTK